MIKSDEGDRTKDKTINGKKYAFDQYGAMVAEWSLDSDDEKEASDNVGHYAASTNQTIASVSEAWQGKGNYAQYSKAWKYFNSVEDGARVSKGWFKVVPAEYLNEGKYDDDEDFWYYADGSGNLYAGEFKTIKGKKYAFRNDGRMLTGLKFILEDDDNDNLTVYADDDTPNFDNEEDFLDNAVAFYEPGGYKCYYFGGGDDGAMRTNKTTVEIDGENHNFYFEKSGSKKGAGVTGEKDDKLYQSGMLLKADSDDKYVVVDKTTKYTTNAAGEKVLDYVTYNKLDDAKEFMAQDDVLESNTPVDADGKIDLGNNNKKKAEDISEAYTIRYKAYASSDMTTHEYFLVNTSGKVIDNRGKNKDGSDYYYVTDNSGKITNIYVED